MRRKRASLLTRTTLTRMASAAALAYAEADVCERSDGEVHVYLPDDPAGEPSFRSHDTVEAEAFVWKRVMRSALAVLHDPDGRMVRAMIDVLLLEDK